MKKKSLKVFSLLLPIALMLLACGCPAKKEVKKTTVPDGPFDPMGYLREEETFIAEFKGFYMNRDGVIYSLNSVTSLKDKDEYNPGLIFEEGGYQCLYNSQINSNGNYVWSLGEFDYPVIRSTDEIRSYGVSEVSLYEVTELNYGFIREMSGVDYDNYAGTIETTEGTKRVGKGYKEYKCMCGDTEIETNFNLEKDTEVTVSWYEGTDYFEYKAIADTRFYSINSFLKSDYDIEGDLGKEGYATYDFSEVEPGMYYLHSKEINSSLKFGEKQSTGDTIIIIE